MSKQIVLGTLGYTIATFMLGATWHFVLFNDLYHRLGAYSRQEPIIALGFASMLIQGIILSFLFRYFHRGISGETGVRLCFLDNLQNPATGAEAKRTPHPSLSPQAGRGQR